MLFKNYKELEVAIKEINVGKATAYNFLKRQREKGNINEKDFFKLRGNMINTYKKEKGVESLNGFMIVSDQAIRVLKKRFGKRKVVLINCDEEKTIIENKILVKEDEKKEEKSKDEERLRKLLFNKNVLTSLGYGDIAANAFAAECIERNMDIISFCKEKAVNKKNRMQKTRRNMLLSSFKRRGKKLELAGYEEPYKVACNDFKREFFNKTGYDLTLLSKEDGAMADFLHEFNMWKIAFSVAHECENRSISS